MTGADGIGFVVIGRNEGERLKRSLKSVAGRGPVVYVDSASTDGSAAFAKELGVAVVALEGGAMTAARARNAGFARLAEIAPSVEFVMFVDGDSEVAADFPAKAVEKLRSDPSVGIVAGRCRERDREASIYKRMCDLEWAGPTGEIHATGGIFMTRRDVFKSVGGFDANVEAAEDDEFCIRVRAKGLKIYRLTDDMCLHDANVTGFAPWWRRSVRAGRAYAQLGTLYPGYFAAERKRAVAWGFVLPVVALGAAPFTGGWSLLLLLLYGASFARTRMNLMKEGTRADDASLYAGFLTFSKFPNFIGMVDFWRRRMTKRAAHEPAPAGVGRAL